MTIDFWLLICYNNDMMKNIWNSIPPIGNTDAYVKAVMKFPLMDKDEEAAFDGSDEAKTKLILSHLRLVVAMVRSR